MTKIKVALLAEEFFDATVKKGAGFGGYGMLARNYITEYLPNAEIEVETILGFNEDRTLKLAVLDGRKKVILLPRWMPSVKSRRLSKIFDGPRKLAYNRSLRNYLESFDVFISIETPHHFRDIFRYVRKKKLIVYVQDPRPQSEWNELDSVIRTDDGSPRPDPVVRSLYAELLQQGRIVPISQGIDLVEKAKDLYQWPNNTPVELVRNPVLVDEKFALGYQNKTDSVLFLGRLDPVKRPWLAMEVARLMPHVQFYFLGKTHDPVGPYVMYPYKDLPNIHLLGHQDGHMKVDLLKKCKFLINSSIHEAIPISFLEALSYGTLIVSCQNPDGITERFGAFTGKILGDGREKADLFVTAIQGLLRNDAKRRVTAEKAISYVKDSHNLHGWIETMREIIRKSSAKDVC